MTCQSPVKKKFLPIRLIGNDEENEIEISQQIKAMIEGWA